MGRLIADKQASQHMDTFTLESVCVGGEMYVCMVESPQQHFCGQNFSQLSENMIHYSGIRLASRSRAISLLR